MDRPAPPNSREHAGSLVVTGSLPCIHCAYDLDTRPLNSPCPECGKPVGHSQESLWLDSTSFLRKLQRGANLALVASMMGPLIYTAGSFAAIFADGVRFESVIIPVTASLAALGPLVALRSVFLFSAIQPGRPSWSEPVLVGVKWLGSGFALAFAIGVYLLIVEATGSRNVEESTVIGVFIAAGELWCLRNLLILAHVRALAQVSNMPRVARAAPFFQIWAAILMAGGAFIAGVVFADFRPRGFNWSIAVIAFGATFIGWLLAWPILLGHFARGIKAIVRLHDSRGRPSIRSTPRKPQVSPPPPIDLPP